LFAACQLKLETIVSLTDRSVNYLFTRTRAFLSEPRWQYEKWRLYCADPIPEEKCRVATLKFCVAGKSRKEQIQVVRSNTKSMSLIGVFAFAAVAIVLQTRPVLAQGEIVATGTFHGAAHPTSGRATIYSLSGKKTLRLTHFKTSNGPDVHVVLIAATDAQDDEKFFDKSVERVELGKLKGNEGDQNYDIPAGTDLSKFKTVSIYCVRYNANFGTAPLEK
jgi:hypothetical protein